MHWPFLSQPMQLTHMRRRCPRPPLKRIVRAFGLGQRIPSADLEPSAIRARVAKQRETHWASFEHVICGGGLFPKTPPFFVGFFSVLGWGFFVGFFFSWENDFGGTGSVRTSAVITLGASKGGVRGANTAPHCAPANARGGVRGARAWTGGVAGAVAVSVGVGVFNPDAACAADLLRLRVRVAVAAVAAVADVVAAVAAAADVAGAAVAVNANVASTFTTTRPWQCGQMKQSIAPRNPPTRTQTQRPGYRSR